MKKTLSLLSLLFLVSLLSVGCMSRTQANVGPVHFGGDVTAHKNWDLSFSSGPERTVLGLGYVTFGVDGNISKCTQAIAASHKTELTHDEG